MQQALRPYVTAGVALVGASLIAVTPMAPHVPDIQMHDVKLTSGGDDLTPWIDQFNTASENATALLNNFYDSPYIGLQQLIANQSGYFQDFFNDPTSSTVASVSGQMQEYLASLLTGLPLQDATDSTTHTVFGYTLEASKQLIFAEISGFLPSSVNPEEVTPIINFLASPLSGIIWGELGPDIAPWVALGNSISAGDDFNETLANMVGAYFNGADLNLDSLIPAINGADLFPAGMNMTNLEIGFGGLLSPGAVENGVGGSIFNSLGIEFNGVPYLHNIDFTADPVGPIGAWESFAQTIGSLLGWDGSGSPLTDVTLPVIPTDFLDGSTIPAAATDLSSLWQDLVAAF